MPFVTITEEMEDRARRDATFHVGRAKAKGWDKVGYQWEKRPEGTFGSYCAEEAVAMLLGIKDFKRDVQRGFGKPDVRNWSVRFGTQRNYGLAIYPRDGCWPYVLVVPGYAPLEYEVVGWIRNAEAVELRARGIGRALGGNLNGWVIPRVHMKPWGDPT